MGESRYFSFSYEAARETFLEAARVADCSIDSIRNPHAGPNGEPLFMDAVLVGTEDAKRTLVVSSGTHGVEGFVGSGIQTRLLREGIGSQLPGGTSLLMIHAINPYGMAHLRRFTEDNVDLNRNFRDHTEPHPRNPSYEKLADVIAPHSLSFWSEVVSWSRLLWFRVTAGKAASQAAVSGGQYSHPDGLFYGGAFDTWSNKTVRSIVRGYLSQASQVIVVDLHTGLGAFGAAEVILNVHEDSPEYQRALAIWGPTLVKSTASGESVSAHLEASLKLAIPKLLPDAEVTAVSLEFGTVPHMEVFKASRAENWLHHHGGMSHPKAHELKMRLLQAFHPDSEDWEASVWSQGKQVIGLALAHFGP
ncbi:M14 family metallopeptidase [Thermodesulfobacteriota bacterium]